MAWSILSSVQKVDLSHAPADQTYLTFGQTIIAQKDRDNSINELAKTMGDAYAFVHLAEPLKKVESQKPIIISLTNQTVECCYFIRDYAKNKDFCMLDPQSQMAADDFCSGKRTAKNLMSDVDGKVKQYKETFHQLRLGLEEHAVIHTEITVLRVLDVVGDLCEISE